MTRSLSILTGTNGIFRDIDSEKSFNSCSHVTAVIRSAVTVRYRHKEKKEEEEKKKKKKTTTVQPTVDTSVHTSVQNPFYSHLLSKKAKIKFRRTVMLPFVLCGFETWVCHIGGRT